MMLCAPPTLQLLQKWIRYDAREHTSCTKCFGSDLPRRGYFREMRMIRSRWEYDVALHFLFLGWIQHSSSILYAQATCATSPAGEDAIIADGKTMNG
jgi:hypothetical protein